MTRRIRQFILSYLQRGTLRRRLAYSLAIVRLILVPVIFLAVYYLFVMGNIVDRIVNQDAPAATMAQQASIEMLVARRAERTFLLFHDTASVRSVNQSLNDIEKTLGRIAELQPGEQQKVQTALSAAGIYANQFQAFVGTASVSKTGAVQQVQSVVHDYEKSLNTLLRSKPAGDRTKLVDELRSRASSFDDQIAQTMETTDPALTKVTTELQASSETILQTLSSLEEQSWSAVQNDHRQARQLLHRAEWTLSIVSGLTFLLSVWISFVLPKQLVQPLVRLKQNVDRAICDDQSDHMNIRAEGELGELAESIRNLIDELRASHTAPRA
jgi:CHASE3 domain sensor protein